MSRVSHGRSHLGTSRVETTILPLALQISDQQALMEAGLDSLGAVELRDTLASQFAIDIPATLIFNHPTAAAIAAFLSSRLSLAIPPTAGAASPAAIPAPRAVGHPHLSTLDATHPAGPTKDEVMAVILETLQELVGLQVQPMQPLMNAGLDSLGAVELRSSLSSRFSLDLPATVIFDYPSADALAAFIARQLFTHSNAQAQSTVSGLEHYHSALDEIAAPDASLVHHDRMAYMMTPWTTTHVVGLSCRYPGGLTRSQGFWAGLEGSSDLPQLVPLARWDMAALYSPDVGAAGRIYARFAACVDHIDMFDANAFRMSPTESMATDPQVGL